MTTILTVICVMLWIIVFAVMVYNREDRIRFYFASKKVQMAQLQEAWDEQERLDKAFDWSAVKVAECREERDYLQDQLHRVARERDNERALKQAASKTAAKLAVELATANYAVSYWGGKADEWFLAYEEERSKRQQAEDALLDYHLDKREKDEEGRAADRGWLADVDNEEE